MSEPASSAVLDGLDAAQAALVTGESQEYVLKFKLMEVVEGIRRRWEGAC